jgi:drug/metabolite transporter (DMT)-like permease
MLSIERRRDKLCRQLPKTPKGVMLCMNHMNPKAISALIFTVILWGFAPALVRGFSLAAGPWDSVFIRLVSVALICLVMLPFSGGYIARKDWWRMLLVSWVGIFGYFLGSIFGFAWIGAGPGGLLMATQPLIIAVMASALGTERLGIPTLIGFGLAFAGTLYMLSGDLALTGSHPLWGVVYIIGSSIAFSINVVFSKPLVQNYGPLRVTVIAMVLSAIPGLLFYRGGVWGIVANLDLRAWLSLFYLGPVGTIVAVITWNYAVGQLRPSTIGGSLYVIPILSILGGWLLLGEPFSTQTIIAGLIILAGVAIAEYGKTLNLRGASGVLSISFAVVAWGTIPVAMRYLLLEVSPETAMFLRLYIAGIVAALVAVWIGAPRLTRGEWLRVAGAGILGALGYQVFATYGMKLIPASWTGMIFGLEPIFIALMAAVLLRENLSRSFIFGLALALLGTAVLVFGSASGSVADVSVVGVVLVTISTLGWAIYTTLIRPVAIRHGGIVIACLSLAFTALPTAIFFTPKALAEFQTLSHWHWLSVFHVSVIATVLATCAWNVGLKTMSNSKAGMFLYAQPVIAAIGGILLLGESLSIWLIGGGLLIFAGVAVSQYNGYTAEKHGEFEIDPYADENEALDYRP